MQKSTLFLAQRGLWPVALFFLFLIPMHVNSQTPAFPGAAGFGRFASGGRGGEVYIVTNLNDAGAGSLRDAVSKPNRIIVFEVGGIIRISSRIVVSSNVTIAGQTAPGDGIVVYGNGMSFSGASNSICRYLRVRMGINGDSGKDALGIANGTNIIFDHLSVSWGRDENFSISWDNKGSEPANITIQNSIIGQGLWSHSCGGLIQTDGGVSLYRNLYIDNKTRNPKVKGKNEFVNNIIYNWGNGGGYIMGDSEGPSQANMINNYFISGPAVNSNTAPFTRGNIYFSAYAAGNYYDNNRDGTLNGVLLQQADYGTGDRAINWQANAYAYPLVPGAGNVVTALQAYDTVLQQVGASYPRRDAVDQLMINELSSLGTQGITISTFTNENMLATGGPGPVSGAPAATDTDRDGIPDTWESAHGLNPGNAADSKLITASGYSNLELYINSIINTPAPDFLRAPAGLTAVAPQATRIQLSWINNSDNETGFLLERSGDGTAYSILKLLAAGTTSFTDTTVTANKTWYYKLRAFDITDTSVYSNITSVKTPPVPSAPAEPTNPNPAHQFSYADAGNITLGWTGSSNALSYAVYMGSHPDSLIKKADVTTVNYTATGLAQKTTYYWRIDATNALGTTTGPLWNFTTATIFPAGIVGDWQMNAVTDGDIVDSSTYNNDGSAINFDDVLWVTGKKGNAIDLSNAGSDGHLLIPHADVLFMNKHPFALSLWIKAPAPSTQFYLAHKGTFTKNTATGATGKWWGIEVKDGKIRFAVDDDITKSEVAVNNNVYFTNTWTHVVVVRDTLTRKLRIYRNGVQDGESTDNTSQGIGSVNPLILANNNDIATPYKGLLDEVKLYNYAPSEMEILQLFHSSPLPIQPFAPSVNSTAPIEGYDTISVQWKGGINTTHYKVYLGTQSGSLAEQAQLSADTAAYRFSHLQPATVYYWRVDAIGAAGITIGQEWQLTTGTRKGLTGHWKLNETSGITAADASSFNHAGTLVTMDSTGWNNAGKFGGNLQFVNPGATGALSIPHAPHLLFDQNSFTISLWVKIPANTYNLSTGGDCYLFQKGTFEANTGKWYGLQLRDGKLTFAIDDGVIKTDITVTVTGAPYNLFNNQWKHLVAIRDVSSKQIKLYIDGVPAAQKAYTTGTTGKLTPLLLGNSAENKPYRDKMDDVRLYNYALSLLEIQALADTLAPIARARNITVPLTNGTAVITAADVNDGSSDASGITALSVNKTGFGCSDIGDHAVILTVTDGNGNQSADTATVTVTGTIPAPVITLSKTDNTATGGAANQLFLGYGAQQLLFTANDGSSYSSYTWSPAHHLNSAVIANPLFTPDSAGVYQYQVTALNSSGCTGDTATMVLVTDARCRGNNVSVCKNGINLCVTPAVAKLLIPVGYTPCTCTTSGTVVDNIKNIIKAFLQVFPNPLANRGSLQYMVNHAGNYRIEVYNMRGQLVQVAASGYAPAGTQFTHELNVAQLANGIYTLKLVTAYETISTRIIVLH